MDFDRPWFAIMCLWEGTSGRDSGMSCIEKINARAAILDSGGKGFDQKSRGSLDQPKLNQCTIFGVGKHFF